jgi:hypothetical protein
MATPRPVAHRLLGPRRRFLRVARRHRERLRFRSSAYGKPRTRFPDCPLDDVCSFRLGEFYPRQRTQAANEDAQIPDGARRFPLCIAPRRHSGKRNSVFNDGAGAQVWYSRVEVQPHFRPSTPINAMANRTPRQESSRPFRKDSELSVTGLFAIRSRAAELQNFAPSGQAPGSKEVGVDVARNPRPIKSATPRIDRPAIPQHARRIAFQIGNQGNEVFRAVFWVRLAASCRSIRIVIESSAAFVKSGHLGV